jgi:uncharacterized membrane protein (DUF4010 family)
MDANLTLLLHTLAALGIGLMLGIQREYDRGRRKSEAEKDKNKRPAASVAGVRTFTIIALCGNLATWLPPDIMPWAIGIGFAFVAAIAIVGYREISESSETDKGFTTESALIATFILGTLTGLGYSQPAIIVGIVILALLQFKRILHRFSYGLSAMDIEQAVQFLIITAIVLPLLPNHTYGPYAAFNPQRIWLMVVLISGIGFASYVAMKIWGRKRGLGLTGILGGLVSSTAVTLAMSRLNRIQPALQSGCVLAIILACGTMFPRVMGLTLLFNPQISAKLLLPIGIVMLVGLVCVGIVWLRGGREAQAEHHGHTPLNPLSLRMAVGFGLFYALVVFAAKIAQHYLGNSGILLVAAASGISDVDPITLTVSHATHLSASIAAQAILIACAVNTFFKLGMALVIAPASARLWLVAGLLPMGILSTVFILLV